MKNLADIGVIGLAVMGENLILNMESRGYTVACYNRTVEKVTSFVEGRAAGRRIVGCQSLAEFVAALERPRRVMMMVKAGGAVDALIEQLKPLLEEGDILIDGGNTFFKDTGRRMESAEQDGLLYIGIGVSGGEEGALKGPSLMPGGSRDAWPAVEKIFMDIAAKTASGDPCCRWVGPKGAGHYVKMVHNGIEYGDMQLICEAYWVMKHRLGMSNEEMSEVFAQWNGQELDSYLVEITRDILAHQQDGEATVDIILDAAGQKGTGKWTVQEALDLGQPLTLISEAVFARCISAMKDERVRASALLQGSSKATVSDTQSHVADLRHALYASKIVSYAQGYQLLRAASEEYDWSLNYGDIALMWRGGCVIRSVFLDRIKEAYENAPALENLMLSPFFTEALNTAVDGWREVVADAVLSGIPMPAMSSALSYYDSYRSATLPANLLQAQRDYFGAHMYERVDHPRGEFFHTDWTGHGGATVSSSYSV